jgi:hypothetical protein
VFLVGVRDAHRDSDKLRQPTNASGRLETPQEGFADDTGFTAREALENDGPRRLPRLDEDSRPDRPGRHRDRPAWPGPRPPRGVWPPPLVALADAFKLVDDAQKHLWSPEGAATLTYLRGSGLIDETIRQARLGWKPGVGVPVKDGTRFWTVKGITIPWLDDDRLPMPMMPATRPPRVGPPERFASGPRRPTRIEPRPRSPA